MTKTRLIPVPWNTPAERLALGAAPILLAGALLLAGLGVGPALASGPVFVSRAVTFGLTNVGQRAAPTFVDIDGDGDLDAFIGNFEGNILYFQNIGSAASPVFAAPVTNPFGLAAVGYYATTPAFADIDGDGDQDAFIGEAYGNILYFRNTGDAAHPTFAAPVIDPFDLADVGTYAAPTFADIDGDGVLDAFIGGDDGNTHYFQNIGSATSPVFTSTVANPLGSVDVGSRAAPTFADIDNNGVLDAFIGNYNGNTLYFKNTGSAASPVFTTAAVVNPFGLAPVEYNAAPAFADIDGDGDQDAFLGDGYGNTVYLRNKGSAANAVFTTPFNPFDLADVGAYAKPTFADINADGDLDTFIGGGDGNTHYFQNIGSAASPVFTSAVANPFGLADVGQRAAPSLADINADGDLDAFIGELYGNTLYFRNTGDAATPAFTVPINNPFGLADVGDDWAFPALVDIDGDGHLDAFIGNNMGDIYYFENTGSETSPVFTTSVTNPFGLANVGSRAAPTFADIDGDGDMDAFIGDYFGNTTYFQNTGSATSPDFAAPVVNPFGLADVGGYATPALADLDGDGDLDAFIGSGDGNTVYFENVPDVGLLKTVQPPSAAPGSAITYTLTYSNAGQETARRVVITDSLPISLTQVLVSSSGAAITQTGSRYVWDVADMASDQGGVITISGVLSSPLAAGSFTNTATIAAASDGNAANNIASAGVTAQRVAPQAADDTASVSEDSNRNVLAVLVNDSDANGDGLSVQAVTTPAHGTATDNDANILYTPHADFVGTDVFTYTISDGALTDTAQVTVTVNAVNKSVYLPVILK